MFNKSLVAIYFLENRLLIAELDSQRKKVNKSVSIEIPKGLISNYQVQDDIALSKIIKNVWTKFGFTEKTVGIIIPEFSTFSKLITLPKLELNELNEAVLWQAQEFLPNGIENMIVDWKVVNKNENGYEVLVYSVLKDILLGYVSVCESAGLFPHGVQTPSLCLTNLINQREGGSLIVYSGFDETILMVCDNEKTLGTSVIQNTDQKEVVATAYRMFNHYRKIDIKKAYLGGKNVSKELAVSLKETLKLDVTLLNPSLTGIDQQAMAELIIPTSLLLGDLKEPSDLRTINLLPGNLVENYRTEKTRIQVWSLTLTITLFTWFCFLIVLGSYLVVNQQILTLKNKNLQKAAIINELLQDEVTAKKINEVADKVLNIKANSIYPETILNLVILAKTPGVKIDNYKMDLEKGNIELVGKSSDRESLVLFKQNLEKHPEVKSVEIPLSSFENITNLEFTLSFHYGSSIEKPIAVPKIQQDIIQ